MNLERTAHILDGLYYPIREQNRKPSSVYRLEKDGCRLNFGALLGFQ